MKDLKKIDIKIDGNFLESDKIKIYVDGKSAEYTPDEVLGVLGKLSEITKALTDNLIMNRMKQINEGD